MAGQPLFSNYLGLDQLNKAIGGTEGYGTQGYDPAQSAAGVDALKGQLTLDNPWYAQNFGLGGSIPSFVDNIYKNFYGREPDAPGKEFWQSKANDYQTGGTADTSDDRTRKETEAWLLTNFLGRSDEFQNKLSTEYGGKSADYKDRGDWRGYQNEARNQRAAVNKMPGVMDPASLQSWQPGAAAANKAMMYPSKLQQGGVDRVVAGGVNLGPMIADAQEAAGKPRDTSGAAAQQDMAGLLNYMVNSGFDEATISKAMAAIKDAANLNKGLYMRNPMSGNAAAAGGMAGAAVPQAAEVDPYATRASWV